MKKSILLLGCMLVGLVFTTQAQESLLISEYIEGSSNNKAVELYNASGEDIDLSSYQILRSNNGATVWDDTLHLAGTITPGAVFVIANPSADEAILNVSDTTHSLTFYNGNDALALEYNNSGIWETIDVIGVLGEDQKWSVAGVIEATGEHTLVRKSTVVAGTTDWASSAGTDEQTSQWMVYEQNNISFIGMHNNISIADARTMNGEAVQINGIATTPNYGFNNGQWYLQDTTGGINVFFSGQGGLEVSAGDEHMLYGTISSFEGQTQITVDSTEVVSTGNEVPLPLEIDLATFLNVDAPNQGMYVTLSETATYLAAESVWPVFGFDWGNSSGTNVYFQVGDDTITYRIDRGESFYDGSAEPADGAEFFLSGILSRFNDTPQYYGAFFADDIIEVTDIADEFTPIADARTFQDSSLVITGIATTPNYGFGQGQWFLQDDTGGINVFFSGQGDLAVAAGDEHILYGTISSYDGQRQIVVDSAEVVSTGNEVPFPLEVDLATFLNVEAPEQGMYVTLSDTATYLATESLWPVDGFSNWDGAGTNVFFLVDDDTLTYRIDRDEAFYDGTAEPADGAKFLLSGILSRFNDTPQFYGAFFEDDIITNSPPSGNLITNGDFESGNDGSWYGNALNIMTEDGNSFNFADVGIAGNRWDVNLSQDVDLTPGEYYMLTFDASAGVGNTRDMLVGIGLSQDPWYSSTQSVTLTDTMQTYNFGFFATDFTTGNDFGSATSRVLFDMGADVGVVVIDNVSLEVAEAPDVDDVRLTFAVDMTDAINNGFFNPAEDGLAVNGTFNNWTYFSWTLDNVGNNIYAADFIMPNQIIPEYHEYKYIFWDHSEQMVVYDAGENKSFETTKESGTDENGAYFTYVHTVDNPAIFNIEEQQSDPYIELYAGGVGGFAGKELWIPVYADIFEAGTASMEFEITNFAELGTFTGVYTDSTTLFDAYGWTTTTNFMDDTLYVASAGADNIGMDGVLFYIGVDVASNIAQGEYYLDMIWAAIDENASFYFDYFTEPIYISSPMLGDVSMNGDVRAYDASLVLKWLVDYIPLSDAQMINGDVTEDGELTALDASYILEYVVDLVDFPITDTPEPTGIAEFGNPLLDKTASGTTINVPVMVRDLENVKSLAGTINLGTEWYTNAEFIWSDDFNKFQREFKFANGDLKFAAAGPLTAIADGSIGTLRITVESTEMLKDQSVTIAKLRWNEAGTQQAVSNVDLDLLITSVETEALPTEFTLGQNYPNPFNPSTTINFTLPQNSDVQIVVYDMLGKTVATLVNKNHSAGQHTVNFNSSQLSSGIYFYQIKAGSFIETKKMTLIK